MNTSNINIGTEQVKAFLAACGQTELGSCHVDIQSNEKKDIADATTKCVITNRIGERFFLLISGSGNPGLVERASNNISALKSCLTGVMADSVLAPVKVGEIAGRSCALWDYYPPFHSRQKAVFAWRKFRYGSMLLDWVHNLCTLTLGPPLSVEETEQGFILPLRQLMENERLSNFHQHAASGIRRIESGLWQPRHCAQHGDLWTGNFLLSGSVAYDKSPFYVIDWAGAKICGYPLFDFSRLAMSLRIDPGTAQPRLNNIAAKLSCDIEDLLSYALSALSELGTRLEHFPHDRYIAMCNKVGAYLIYAQSLSAHSRKTKKNK